MKTTRTLLLLLFVSALQVQCSKDEEGPKEVLNPPIADFTANATTVRAGTRVQFINTSVNATSYQWTFEGGTPGSSTESAPFIQYQTVGTYDVTLRVANSDGEDTLTLENYINVVDTSSMLGVVSEETGR